MSSSVSGYRRPSSDHFEPEADLDPAARRALRGKLEQIDYTAYVSNREVIGHMVTRAEIKSFQRLAIAAAQARAQWINSAVAFAETGQALTPMQVDKLSDLRRAYEELEEVYAAMRRLVERGYVGYITNEKP